jgi:hypothetical protein
MRDSRKNNGPDLRGKPVPADDEYKAGYYFFMGIL